MTEGLKEQPESVNGSGALPLLCRRWRRQPPDRDGWWKFREDSFGESRILICNGGVASDADFLAATGRDCEDDWEDSWSENYWEGNDPAEMTFGPLTTGVWMFDSAA